MDRREALKKMAVGGVTVVGATAVMSSPAFAYSQPLSATPPTIGWVFPFPTNFRNKLRLNCTAGAATCPQSSTAPSKAGQLTLLNATITATFSPASRPSGVSGNTGNYGLWYFRNAANNSWPSGSYSTPLPNPWNFLANAHGPSGTTTVTGWVANTVRLLKLTSPNHPSAPSGSLLSLGSYTNVVNGFLPPHTQGGVARAGDIVTLIVRQGFRCVYATGQSSVRTFTYSNWQWRPNGNTATTSIGSGMNFLQIVAPTISG